MVCRSFILLCLLFALNITVQAQQVSSYHKELAGNVRYDRTGNPTFHTGNLILKEIARQVLKEPWQVKVNVAFDFQMTIIGGQAEDSLLLRSHAAQVTGDTLYRGFSIADFLVPAYISLRIKWASRLDTTSFIFQSVDRVPIGSDQGIMLPVQGFRFNPSIDTVLISDVDLFYDSAAWSRFQDHIALIHNYHASLVIFDSLRSIVSKSGFQDPSSLPFIYARTDEYNKALKSIEALDVANQLLSYGPDAGNFIKRYADAFREGRTLTFNFIDGIRASGLIPVTGQKVQDFFAACIHQWCLYSQLMDNRQGRIYADFLEHYFDNPSFPEDPGITGLMLRKIYPEANPDTLERFWLTSRYESFCLFSRNLIAEKRFSEAFRMMKFAEQMRVSSPLRDVCQPDSSLLKMAAVGVFNSFVGIADGCIQTGKLGMADLYLRRAVDYAAANPCCISSDSAYRRVYSNLFFLRNTGCDRLLAEQQYQAAIDCYNEFELAYTGRELQAISGSIRLKIQQAREALLAQTRLETMAALRSLDDARALSLDDQAQKIIGDLTSAGEGQTNYSDSVSPALAGLRYNRLVEEAHLALEKRQFTLSVSLFDSAKAIAVDYPVNIPASFDSLYRRAWKNYLVIRLTTAYKKIWLSDFDGALAERNHVISEINQHQLNQDPFLDSALVRFDLRMNEQKCRNLSDSVSLKLIRADRAVFLRNYLLACELFREAGQMISGDPGCRIGKLTTADSLSKYGPAADYQRILSLAATEISIGNFSGAVNWIVQADSLYQYHELTRFFNSRVSLAGFARDRANQGFTEFLMNRSLDMKNYTEAFSYLSLAREQGAAAGGSSKYQRILGKALAEQDHALTGGAEPVTDLDKYIADSPWFEEFRSSYLSERKRLIK